MKKFILIIFIVSTLSCELKAQQAQTIRGFTSLSDQNNVKLEKRTFSFQPKGNVKDLVLDIQNISANLIIKGDDRSDIRIDAEGLLGLPEKAKGLRVVSKFGEDNTKMGINLEQEGNEVKLTGTNVKRSRQAVFTLIVPRDMGLSIEYLSWNSKKLVIENMKGGIEAKVSTANILLDQVTGPLSISTRGGDIEVKYSEVSSDAVTVLSSSSGDIDITIAESANADFNINQTSGEIFTDLDIAFINEESVESKKNAIKLKNNSAKLITNPDYPLRLSNKLVTFRSSVITKARLNDGGIKIGINSIAGDVYLRKK